jgi:cyclic pyranopterin phosphate synthase
MSLDPTFSRLGPGGGKVVDLSESDTVPRGAIARARVRLGEKVVAAIASDEVAKTRILDLARVAGIQAAKRAADLIPLAQSTGLDLASIEFEIEGTKALIRAEVRSVGRTGLEIEAMMAASIAALTLYDMCKEIDRGIVIEAVYLEEKWGGRSGPFRRQDAV